MTAFYVEVLYFWCMCVFIREASGLDHIVYSASGLHGHAFSDVIVCNNLMLCSLRVFSSVAMSYIGMFGKRGAEHHA